METKLIKEKQDLTFLKWSHIRGSSGTAGSFLKSESITSGHKKYYKLSNYDYEHGIIGHECINEYIVDRLLTVLGVEHLHYELIHADIELDGKIHETYLCSSEDFKKKGESKIALDTFYSLNSFKGESHYDFCVRNGWKEYIDTMIVIDFLIMNRDRHGANIEVLRNARAHTLRIAPLFDHGVSLLYSCMTDDDVKKFDVLEDRPCRNFIGSRSCLENLTLIDKAQKPLTGMLNKSCRDYIFEGLEGIIPEAHIEKIWQMIYERYQVYENF